MAMIRDARGRFVSGSSGHTRDPGTGRFKPLDTKSGLRKVDRETRIKVVGAEIVYRERGDFSFDALRAAIDGVQRRSTNLTPAFQAFKADWFAQNYLIFDSEGIPPWAPLKEDYAKWKSTLGDLPILQLTGRLAQSLTSMTDETVYDVRPRSLQMGTTVPYSEPLQKGTKNMADRPHDILLDDTWAKLVNTVGSYVELPLEAVLG